MLESSVKYPKRAVITGGMPYGDKLLHFGHVGGMYIHADIYARFLRSRIGKENVIFVSGTDCYGSGPIIKYEQKKAEGYTGSLEDFISENHNAQKEQLDMFGISLNLFAASGIGMAAETHSQYSAELFNTLYNGGYLKLDENLQFFDEKTQSFLNGRQVKGRCPISGCKSETAYADECSLGHQYSPSELIAPVSVTSGEVPVLKPVCNWYFDLERFGDALKKRQTLLKEEGIHRKILLSTIDDFLKPPVVLIKTEELQRLKELLQKLPACESQFNEETHSATLVFNHLKDRELACRILKENGFRFRTGTTLVPFRLSGNVPWGIPVPEHEGVTGQSFWVWPESLWAPISFIRAYLKDKHGTDENWEQWWFDNDARVYQFIGEDNIYFYAVAEMGLFMALNEIRNKTCAAEVTYNLPVIIPNRHVFYGSKKASSSGALQPPPLNKLLEHYTLEQLRMHFAHMALNQNSVSFAPQAILGGSGFDTVTAEGNILTNVYNRIVRSCFYTMQKYFDNVLPKCEISDDALNRARELVSSYDLAMYKFEFPRVIDIIDVYLRDVNKAWAQDSKLLFDNDSHSNKNKLLQLLTDTFHAVRLCATLLYPFAPMGCETIREYLGIDERLFSWEYIDKPLCYFFEENHKFKFLEPRVDFFCKKSFE